MSVDLVEDVDPILVIILIYIPLVEQRNTLNTSSMYLFSVSDSGVIVIDSSVCCCTPYLDGM